MEPGGDAITELAADHRELEDLFSQIELQPVDHPRRRELADRLTAELVRHTVAEEPHLYPAVRKHIPHGAAMADKELADHTRAEAMLKDLEDLSVDDPRFNDTIAKLKLEVASHVREEEHELFPKLAATHPPAQPQRSDLFHQRAEVVGLEPTASRNRVLHPADGSDLSRRRRHEE
ncbi:hemerythrin domain-containing protein [Streptomyces sp. CY1]|uniref:hemerythrin domain-containing protein n=1 Tax=Streptomyces sp. CY1 TaxID=3388313 RepID=UPI00399F7570